MTNNNSGDKVLHIVYPLKKSSVGDCEEFKYSLRSIEKHVKCKYDVTLIGYKPKWLNASKVRYIYYGQCDEKERNILHARDIAANIFDEFVLFMDDFYLLTDFEYSDFEEIYYLEDLSKTKKWGNRHFQQMLKKMYHIMLKKGYPTYNYTTHAPRFLKSEIVKKVINEFDLFNDSFVSFESYYYNYIRAHTVAKPIKQYKVARYDSTPFNEKEAEGKIFLNFDEAGMQSGIWDYVKKRFNFKSSFEL